MSTPRDPDVQALIVVSSALGEAFGAIEGDQLAWPTPCDGWDVAALVDHVTGGNWFTAQILDGHTATDAMAVTVARFDAGGVSIPDAVASVTEQLAAFGRPDVLDRTWSHVAGDLSGRQIIRLRLHDLIVHTWDLEQALRPPASLLAELVQWGLAEFADPDSLVVEHFGLGDLPPDRAGDDEATYLARFGRSR